MLKSKYRNTESVSRKNLNFFPSISFQRLNESCLAQKEALKTPTAKTRARKKKNVIKNSEKNHNIKLKRTNKILD